MRLAYVGSVGRHLLRFRDINQPDQATITATDTAFAQANTYTNEAGSPVLPAFIADAAPNGFAQNGLREASAGYYAITATGDGGIGNPFLGGGGPRSSQLAGKFTF
ncbi:MAG TPA: hypothetical protein VMB19_02980 [Silvibacterium sp.]|nr:hypothetical protein [Silvibacterium sp.]